MKLHFKIHKNFYITLATSLGITFLTSGILIALEPVYVILNNFFLNNLYTPFFLLTVGNNLYQVYAHIFTGTKFMGYSGIEPHGSRDNQTLTVFTISNIFDILGWLTIFVLHKKAHPFLAFLTGSHYGTGIVSILFNKTFQNYYIEGKEKNKVNEYDSFSYFSWRVFRTAFVFTDALARGYSCLQFW